MLLDRRKIRRWAKWVALGLAIIFALSFLFMGVGYGGAGFNISEIFSGGGCTETTEPTAADAELEGWLASLEADPDNTGLMLKIADKYEALYNAGSGVDPQNFDKATQYLDSALTVDPSLKDVYLRLAGLYLEYAQANAEVGQSAQATQAYKDAARVLNKATSVDPENPQIYLDLGIAQRGAGELGAAILAWQKYLQLDPEGDRAAAIRSALEQMTAPSTTTTIPSTTTTSVSTTTTATD